MYNISNLEKEELRYNSNFNIEKLNSFCDCFGFIKGQKTGIILVTTMDNDDLSRLLDHAYLFEKKDGKQYYAVNTYLNEKECNDCLDKYNLRAVAVLTGKSYWDSRACIVVFEKDYLTEALNDYLKTIKKYW